MWYSNNYEISFSSSNIKKAVVTFSSRSVKSESELWELQNKHKLLHE